MMQRAFGPLAIGLLLSLGTFACGSSVTSGTGGAGGGASQSSATIQSYCEGKVARDQKCDPANAVTLEACLADGDSKCLFSGIRAEVRDEIVACANARACNTSDDACYYEPGLVAPAAGQNEFIAACQAKLTECSNSFGDDICSTTILTAAGYAKLMPCLEEACTAVGDCLDTAVAAICPGI